MKDKLEESLTKSSVKGCKVLGTHPSLGSTNPRESRIENSDRANQASAKRLYEFRISLNTIINLSANLENSKIKLFSNYMTELMIFLTIQQ